MGRYFRVVVAGEFPSQAVAGSPVGRQLLRTVSGTILDMSARSSTRSEPSKCSDWHDTKMCAHQTFPRDGGSCCDSARNVRRCNEPRFSPNTGTKKQNMVHKVYFQKQNKTKKLTNDRIQENWHICLPFEESNAEDISNNKRQSGGIWFRISKQIITMFSLKRCVDAPF